MKKTIIFLLIFTCIGSAKAQLGLNFVSISSGYGLKNAVNVNLSLNRNTKYHNQWEAGVEYVFYPDGYYSAIAAIAIRPVFVRSRNTVFRYKAGVNIGFDGMNFIAAPALGLELERVLCKGVSLFLGNTGQVVFWAPKEYLWRARIEAGVRLPLN